MPGLCEFGTRSIGMLMASAKCLTLSLANATAIRKLQSTDRLVRLGGDSIDRSIDRSPNANQVINDRQWIEITGVQRSTISWRSSSSSSSYPIPPMPSLLPGPPPTLVALSQTRSSAAGSRSLCCCFFFYYLYKIYSIPFSCRLRRVASNFNIKMMIMITWLWLRRTHTHTVSKRSKTRSRFQALRLSVRLQQQANKLWLIR